MKYQCEVCGVIFTEQGKCTVHEKECRAKYDSLLFITDELNALIGAAKVQNINLGVAMPAADGKADSTFCAVRDTEFKAEKNRIIIHVNVEAKKPEKADKTKQEEKPK